MRITRAPDTIMSETPNAKHQTPTNFQIPNSNRTAERALASLKVGVWCLVFGVCPFLS